MAEITRYIKHRRDTAANWTSNNPILLAGQLGIETDGLTTTPKFKIGDGVNTWSALPYFYGGVLSAQNLNNVLTVGNTTGGTDMVITDDDIIQVGTTANRYIGFSTSTIVGGLELVNLNSNDHIILQDAGGIHIDTTYIQVPQVTASRILATDASNKITGAYTTTGSGTVLALSTSPTFTTDITTPLIIGGTAVGSNISYKSTTAAGTSTAAAHTFTGGNNGGTTIATLYNSGQVNIGNYASPTNLRQLTVGQDTAYLSFGSLVGATSIPAIYMNQATPSVSNFTLYDSGSNTAINCATNFYIMRGGTARYALETGGLTHAWSVNTISSGAYTPYTFIVGANTGQSASTEISNFKISGASKTWANGGGATTIATQRWNYFTANTAATSGGGTLTISESIGLDVEAAITSGVTITNNFAARFTAGTATVKIGHLTGSTTVPAIYLAQSTPSSTNYNLISDGSNCVLNSVNDTRINVNASIHARFQLGTTTFSPSATTTGATNAFVFSPASNTNQTLSTEISGFLYNSYSRQWATGALTTQREHYLKTVTYSFVGASTITNAYGLYVEAATAGTNATITNNWSLGTNGGIFLNGVANTVLSNAALATTATTGFLHVPSCAGTPTGVPTLFTGTIPVVVDSTNNKMYIYSGGAWVALN